MSRFGPHIDPPLALIPAELMTLETRVFQTTLRDPRRLSKEGIPDEVDQQAFLEGMAGIGGWWGMAHASMLTSLGSPDPRIRHASIGALAGDANLAASLGLAGVCFHVGYEKGHASREAALDAVAAKLDEVLTKLKPGAKVLLENGCEGTELGQTVAEIGRVVKGVQADPAKLGVTLDTCHLHVSGFDMAAPDAPERLAGEIEAAGLTPYLTSLHLNDAREPCGSHRDRHATPGRGTIGEGLRRLIAHPMFAELPCILEISESEVPVGIAFLTSS
ncbi:MAG TPA: deoxyribonuclease IV [Chthonomonadaceae bacterium]|nr:deoxyribonuclease IV [Chthonomonadaceae bacterium]